MWQLNEYKIPKEQRSLSPNKTQQRIDHAREKDKNTYEFRILLLFFIAILLFSSTIDVSLKCKCPKKKDVILSFGCFRGTENDEISDLNFGRNGSRINRNDRQDFILNPLIFLDSSQEIFTKSLLPLYIENNYYVLFCLEKSLLYWESSQIKCNHNIFVKLLTKINYDNNLEIYKETKLFCSLRNILNEAVLDTVALCLNKYDYK